jgi:hypothetical protein
MKEARAQVYIPFLTLPELGIERLGVQGLVGLLLVLVYLFVAIPPLPTV